MSFSINTTTSDGVTTNYPISFTNGIYDRANIIVQVEDDLDGGGNQLDRSFTWVNDGMISLDVAAPAGKLVTVKRVMNKTEPDVNYVNGAILDEDNMNQSLDQLLNLIHEVLDGSGISSFNQDLDFNGYRGTNAAYAVASADLTPLQQVQELITAASGITPTNNTTSQIAHNGAYETFNLKTYFDSIEVNGATWGLVGDGVTPNEAALQAVINHCIQYGRPLRIPEGTFILNVASGDNAHAGTDSAIRLDLVTAPGQGLVMRGAGMGKTIFKNGDGENDIGGRYTRMFMCLLSSTEATTHGLGHYHLSDFTCDHNARSNAAPPTLYEWEASHSIAFQGTEGATTIQSIIFENIELKDKVGAGIVVGPTTVDTELLVVRNIHSPASNHPTATGPTIGEKGCVETAIDSDLTVFDAVHCNYSQIETTDTAAANEVSRFKMSNCKINTLEYTDNDGYTTGTTYRYVDMVNTHCVDGFVARGIKITATNCWLNDTIENFYIDSKFTNCHFLLAYDVSGNSVDPWYANTPTALATAGISTSVSLVNCTFMIDSDAVAATPSGYALRGSLSTTEYGPKVHMINCKFDPRLYGVIDTYSTGGHWKFSGCEMAGHNTAVYAGAFGSYVNSVELNHCDFSNVTGTYLHIQSATGTYDVKVNGTYLASDWSETTAGAVTVDPYYFVKPKLMGTAAPVAGEWVVGHTVDYIAPAVDGNNMLLAGAVCTVKGTPGTWVSKYISTVSPAT